MKLGNWIEQPIGKHHDRQGFDCGVDALNVFLAQHARRAHIAGSSKTYIANLSDKPNKVLGYYSLAPAHVAYADTPEVVRRRLGRHDVGMFRLGRLAVARECHGQGLGGQLLLAAGRRCLAVAQEVGGVALLIDAKDEAAAAWYRGYGAVELVDAQLTLCLPLATIEKALKG